MAEDSLCGRWLLFLADEYDREALSHKIWNLAGIHVALCYQVIDNGRKKDGKSKTTPVRVLHIKINRIHQTVMRSRIKYLYSSKAMVFPLGFKMQLIRDHRLLMNTQAKEKATSLQVHQARFLAQMETCSMWELATLDLIDQQTQATLLQIIMNILDPLQLTCKLFHVVNKVYIHDRYIFHFHPSQSQEVQEVVAGLLVFLTGLWDSTIITAKFHKFLQMVGPNRQKTLGGTLMHYVW